VHPLLSWCWYQVGIQTDTRMEMRWTSEIYVNRGYKSIKHIKWRCIYLLVEARDRSIEWAAHPPSSNFYTTRQLMGRIFGASKSPLCDGQIEIKTYETNEDLPIDPGSPTYFPFPTVNFSTTRQPISGVFGASKSALYGGQIEVKKRRKRIRTYR